MRVKDAVGRFGEDLAVRRLSEAGLVVLDRNWRCSDGEIDVVARDGDVLAFVEVKTRSGLGFGDPSEAVNPSKRGRLRRLAMRWIDENHDAGGRFWSELRFDVVAVVRLAPGGPSVRHIKGAF